MMKQTPGRLFLADQHGTLTSACSSRCSVFSFGAFQDVQRPAEGRLLAFNEEMLGGGQQLTLPAPQDVYCIMLPLTGEIGCGDALSQELVQVEEVWVARVPAGHTVGFINPYPDQAVNFLHIWVAAEQGEEASAEVFRYSFRQLEGSLAEVVSRSRQRHFSLSIGRFMGRQEAVYQQEEGGFLLFAYVLTGAFEIEGRLLHAKDGLALWQATEAELEALSNNALVVVFSC